MSIPPDEQDPIVGPARQSVSDALPLTAGGHPLRTCSILNVFYPLLAMASEPLIRSVDLF
jgi:hypothetical protein